MLSKSNNASIFRPEIRKLENELDEIVRLYTFEVQDSRQGAQRVWGGDPVFNNIISLSINVIFHYICIILPSMPLVTQNTGF